MGDSRQLWNQLFCEGEMCVCVCVWGVKGSQRATFVPLPEIVGL